MYTVIMAGGSGTRFWPRSRKRLPKQFLPIGSDTPLLQQTLRRCAGEGGDLSRLLVVAGRHHQRLVEEVAPELPAEQCLYEAAARNTAAAIGYACVWISRREPDAVAAVLPSDHVIDPAEDFRRALAAAAEVAEGGGIVTIGVQPTRPETGYGYISRGAQLGEQLGLPAFRVDRFVEKPDAETARGYLAAGTYLWNAGMFIFKVGVMLDAIRAHMPALAQGLDQIAAALERGDSAEVDRLYPTLEAQSIDYGVMERVDDVAVIPASFRWSDVGSWAALSEVVDDDGAGNVVTGDALLIDTAGSVVDATGGRLVAVLGCQDLVVVDTPDALLVIPRERCQEVRRVLEALGQQGREALT